MLLLERQSAKSTMLSRITGVCVPCGDWESETAAKEYNMLINADGFVYSGPDLMIISLIGRKSPIRPHMATACVHSSHQRLQPRRLRWISLTGDLTDDLALTGDDKTTLKIMAVQTQRWLDINLIADLVGDWKTGPKIYVTTLLASKSVMCLN